MSEEPRRREGKKARTRRQIFESAFALFRERGFEAVTVDEIARAADLARGTFFQHFSSKSELIAEWDRKLAAELSSHFGPGSGRGSGLAVYRELAEWLAVRWPRRVDLLGALLAQQLRAASQGGGELLAALESLLREGQRAGAIRRSASPRQAAWLLLAGSLGSVAGLQDERAGASPPGAGALLQALFSGLREPKPRVAWRPRDTGPRA